MTEKKLRRGISLTEDEWKRVKVMAAEAGLTISEWFSTLLVGAAFDDPEFRKRVQEKFDTALGARGLGVGEEP